MLTLKKIAIFFLLIILTPIVFANPYWDQNLVPVDQQPDSLQSPVEILKIKNTGLPCLRLRIDWSENENYDLKLATIENSATSIFLKRSLTPSTMGSYRGEIRDLQSGKILAYDAIGTGKEYRKLARAITFRFPVPSAPVLFQMKAEDPQTGEMKTVLKQELNPIDFKTSHSAPTQIYLIKESKVPNPLALTIYAEGYKFDQLNLFLEDAKKLARSLEQNNFPGFEYFQIQGVFSPSKKTLGTALDLGLPVNEYDSHLGLYYPYWDNFGRWYHVIYPSNEEKFRQALSKAPYDYPIALVPVSSYWGVGNYMSHTAIPARSSNFTYLLLHELGHFFGLNEEYTEGGRTELEFAPDIFEPWSPNITFLNGGPESLKWANFVQEETPIPTPFHLWSTATNKPRYGAYLGGYAGSPSSSGKSHTPGRSCIMDRGQAFCSICQKALHHEILRGQ